MGAMQMGNLTGVEATSTLTATECIACFCFITFVFASMLHTSVWQTSLVRSKVESLARKCSTMFPRFFRTLCRGIEAGCWL
eukprot:scaffold72061_cov22-Tisochrysis_lutea.AAC.1